jgi:hypothetical protein
MISGDFNVDLDSMCETSCDINTFLNDNNFTRCDLLFPSQLKYTYINESLNHFSRLDYMVCNNVYISNFEILDLNVNLSDHLPIRLTCQYSMQPVAECSNGQDREPTVTRLRWDHGDIVTRLRWDHGVIES